MNENELDLLEHAGLWASYLGRRAAIQEAAYQEQEQVEAFDEEADDMPFEDELITGYRMMWLDHVLDGDLRLDFVLSGMTGYRWQSKELTAECDHGPTGKPSRQKAAFHLRTGVCLLDNRPGVFDFPCGIYLTRVEQRSVSKRAVYASAYCTAWGYVVEHELGYRAQHVRIESIKLVLEPEVFNYYGYSVMGQHVPLEYIFNCLVRRYQVPVTIDKPPLLPHIKTPQMEDYA